MINFNGRTFTEEEFEEFVYQQQLQKFQQYEDFRNSIKCGYAVIQDINYAFCGLDRKALNCENCASYKEKIFEIIE